MNELDELAGDPNAGKVWIADELHCVAVVRVTLEIPLNQPWRANATVEQVFREAKRDALVKVENLAPHYRMVGEPVVEVITSYKRKS